MEKTQAELQTQLHIRVHNPLLELHRTGTINRIKTRGVNVYISPKTEVSKKQLLQREIPLLSTSLEELANWLIIDVLVAIIQCSKKEVDAEEILKKLDLKNKEITIKHIKGVVAKFNLKKTLGF